MTTKSLDRRVTPARPDRAAEFLRGTVEARDFVPGRARMVTAPLAPLRRQPQWDAPLDTEALRGEAVTVYEETAEGWVWVQLGRDGYVGYTPASALGPPEEPTHKVAALRTFVYPGPNLKLPVCAALTLGALCRPDRVVDGFAAIPEGFVWAGHLEALDRYEADFVAVAERFAEVPYLWGGRSSLGLDCSALVQLSLAVAGRAAPRDSDMQESSLGKTLGADELLRRGDLVFWKGHVGIMRDGANLLHANAHAMMVSSEPLTEARTRVRAATGAEISCIRRLRA